jgi:formylglycine-generating enzyme required for sulfatase activity
VGVSWYEAIAFCKWLSEASGESILLPSEAQWQRAAQARPDGSDSCLTYPWGNDFDLNCCNTEESDIGHTTPVTKYLDGASPCGVMDMSGNVWEWCLTAYYAGKDDLDGTNIRTRRGGSSSSYQDGARAVYRDLGFPLNRNNNIGFRLVRPPSNP